MLYAVLKTFLRLFTSRKGSLTVQFENQLADSTERKYQDRKQLVQVLRHWREDKEFARHVDLRDELIMCYLFIHKSREIYS